jgi:hypothetical protein
VSGLPHVPPPSMLKASPLTMLLMVFYYYFYTLLAASLTAHSPPSPQDPHSPATDFINVVAIHREDGALAKKRAVGKRTDPEQELAQ